MQFQDEGYIINLRRHGEKSLILTVLTRHHGKLVGYVKNCLTKKNLGVYQLGNRVSVDAYARLEENMWSFRVELLSPAAVNFMNDARKLAALASLCSLCNEALRKAIISNAFFIMLTVFLIL